MGIFLKERVFHNPTWIVAICGSLILHLAIVWILNITDDPYKSSTRSSSAIDVTFARNARSSIPSKDDVPESAKTPPLPTSDPSKKDDTQSPRRKKSRPKRSDIPSPKPSGVAMNPASNSSDGSPVGVAIDGQQEGTMEVDVAAEPSSTGDSGGDASKDEVDLEFSWNDFETTFGEQAQKQRESYVAQKQKKRAAGRGFGAQSKRVELALRHRSVLIPPGRQEPLGDARASLFQLYIAALNKKIGANFTSHLKSIDTPFDNMHKKIQNTFLGQSWFYVKPPVEVSATIGYSPLKDYTLKTVAELEIDANGKLSDVLVTRTSGNVMFDSIAVSSILAGEPFPVPDLALLSFNHMVYLRWAFYRDYRKNGPLSVGGFILRPPPEVSEIEEPDASVSEY